MRGKHRRPTDRKRDPRIIPAHAGQTDSTGNATPRTADHPRACGANWVPFCICNNEDGSSPRMRGKPVVKTSYEVAVRIIPAHAGQTPWSWYGKCSPSDHPRACGANESTEEQQQEQAGSSPRMRGKRDRLSRILSSLRIIPAHAGQTTAHGIQEPQRADHPRACGANLAGLAVLFHGDGSSPRMRGKLYMIPSLDDDFRIIPAHAGQTDTGLDAMLGKPDHPRACGANSPILCENS